MTDTHNHEPEEGLMQKLNNEIQIFNFRGPRLMSAGVRGDTSPDHFSLTWWSLWSAWMPLIT